MSVFLSQNYKSERSSELNTGITEIMERADEYTEIIFGEDEFFKSDMNRIAILAAKYQENMAASLS